jgi:hypothetical protein
METRVETPSDKLDRAKRDKLLDIIRRVIANPENAKEAADEIAQDWFPMIKVDARGAIHFRVGSGRKR